MSLALFTFCGAASAQGQYSQDLNEYFTKFKSLVERTELTSPKNRGGKLAIEAESLELAKKLVQLSLEAARANLALVEAGEPNNNYLLLVASSAESLLLANKLMNHYIYTGEKTFLVQSNAAFAIAKALRDTLR